MLILPQYREASSTRTFAKLQQQEILLICHCERAPEGRDEAISEVLDDDKSHYPKRCEIIPFALLQIYSLIL